jgi:hypothetical protein
MTRMPILLLLLVTHTRAAPLDPQVEQRELHNEAEVHHRFAAWAESHGWHQDGPHHEQKSEHNDVDERDDNMLSAASFLTATQTEPSCGGVCKTDADCPSDCSSCSCKLLPWDSAHAWFVFCGSCAPSS